MYTIKGFFNNGEMREEDFTNKREFECCKDKIFSNSTCTKWEGIYKNGIKLNIDTAPKYIADFLKVAECF